MANAVANGLRHRGIDVLITTEAGHEGWDDPQQLRFARVEGRVLVTQDDDLLRLVHEGADHAGIVYYKTQTRSPEYQTDLARLVADF